MHVDRFVNVHGCRLQSESSDSSDEPADVASRDADVRYLTSRATSPMDPADQGVFVTLSDRTSTSTAARNRLLARTKTKKYPVGDRKRRRQLKNVSVQVSKRANVDS